MGEKGAWDTSGTLREGSLSGLLCIPLCLSDQGSYWDQSDLSRIKGQARPVWPLLKVSFCLRIPDTG